MTRILTPVRAQFPGRAFFAWVLALFIPRVAQGGGAFSILIVIAMIGALAAVALPAYHDYTIRAKISGAIIEGNTAASAVGDHFSRNKVIPRNLAQVGIPSTSPTGTISGMSLDPTNGSITITLGVSPLGGKMIVLVPMLDDKRRVVSTCERDSVSGKFLPTQCRSMAKPGIYEEKHRVEVDSTSWHG